MKIQWTMLHLLNSTCHEASKEINLLARKKESSLPKSDKWTTGPFKLTLLLCLLTAAKSAKNAVDDFFSSQWRKMVGEKLHPLYFAGLLLQENKIQQRNGGNYRWTRHLATNSCVPIAQLASPIFWLLQTKWFLFWNCFIRSKNWNRAVLSQLIKWDWNAHWQLHLVLAVFGGNDPNGYMGGFLRIFPFTSKPSVMIELHSFPPSASLWHFVIIIIAEKLHSQSLCGLL